jgi:maltose alpha-D-glucosyltransferase/alpha-amylase
VNVLAQRRDAVSLLTWFERILHTRRECEEIGAGEHDVMNVNIPGVLVHRATGARGAMLFVHNLCRHHCRIRLELQSGENHRPLNVAADAEYDEDIDLLSLEINSYGYRWLRLNHTPWI